MPEREWSVLLTREGRTSAKRFRVRERRAVALLTVSVAAASAVLIGVGRWSAQRSVPEAVALLQGEVDSLREENSKVALLAQQVAELEGSYNRLRAVMGGDVEPSARDILLPLLASADGSPGRDSGSSIPTVWPLVEAGFITRTFGDSVPGEGPHIGLDIAVPVGSYVRSAGDGLVAEAAEDAEYGRFVRVVHDDGVSALYAHNSWTFVVAGDSVETGEVIALSGNSGRSSAPHLHLEIAREGVAVDPLPFVAGRL